MIGPVIRAVPVHDLKHAQTLYPIGQYFRPTGDPDIAQPNLVGVQIGALALRNTLRAVLALLAGDGMLVGRNLTALALPHRASVIQGDPVVIPLELDTAPILGGHIEEVVIQLDDVHKGLSIRLAAHLATTAGQPYLHDTHGE